MTLQVRASTYRGETGYTLSGTRRGQVGGWPVRIFFTHESPARRHRDALNAAPLNEQPEIDWSDS